MAIAPKARGKASAKILCWLASYPKSGNTWLRAFLANYLLDREAPLAPNQLAAVTQGDALAAHYTRLARAKGLDPLTREADALALRQEVLTRLGSQGGGALTLIKTHNANQTLAARAMIPAPLTRVALYVVRDPLDMLLSYADHYATDTETAAKAIASAHNRILAGNGNVTQYLGRWSEHVLGWSETRAFPVLVLRYEDMLSAPHTTFAKALTKLGVPLDEARLDKAVRFSSFETLSAQESTEGFIERSPHSARFFRSGRAGEGRERLPADLIARIEAEQAPAMRRFGYLP
ncbi:MAG: sulfotransferase domain-containing protein [Pseudomonadota bacterium]